MTKPTLIDNTSCDVCVRRDPNLVIAKARRLMAGPLAPLLTAMSARGVPVDGIGPWSVERYRQVPGFEDLAPPDNRYMVLARRIGWCSRTRKRDIVMVDTLSELMTHIQFVRRARGRVLITGLGLGCVVRGCLASSRVESVTVIERDPRIAALVWPSIDGDPRARLRIADAARPKTWVRPDDRWDCAWHDLWSDTVHLDVLHARVMVALQPTVPWQACWHFDRHVFNGLWKRVVQRTAL